MLQNQSLAEQAKPFLDYLDDWMAEQTALPITQAVPDPAKAAVLSVDVINGFCYEGPLASPRVAEIVDPITRLFELAWQYGVRNIVLSQEMHEPDALEFAQFPAHCVRGTPEAETVDSFKRLPFYDQMTVIGKNSINPAMNTGLSDWVARHPEIDTYIVVGDCTDLCTYQLAMYLRLDANSRQLPRRVIVPIDCVQTFDIPVDTARQIGALPHPGDLIHAMFLHHMLTNGIEIVSTIV
ncbi:MAG: cysteine hydrolase [Chloroflexi bacterium]|nr:MAG: cysteine hydrolase [Chloroflexota bacterium]